MKVIKSVCPKIYIFVFSMFETFSFKKKSFICWQRQLILLNLFIAFFSVIFGVIKSFLSFRDPYYEKN